MKSLFLSTSYHCSPQSLLIKRVTASSRNLNKTPLFLLGQIWILMTSSHFSNSPCRTTFLCLVIELIVLLWPISAWKRSRNLRFEIHLLPPKIWERYVDDSFCIIRKGGVSAFHDTSSSIDRNIPFASELECDGKISFLDNLISLRNEPPLLMFIESPLTQTNTLILILITTVNIRPAQKQLFCTEP